MTSIAERVIDVVAYHLSAPTHTIHPESTFAELGADEVDFEEILLGTELEFGIGIGQDDSDHFHAVEDLINHVTRELEQ